MFENRLELNQTAMAVSILNPRLSRRTAFVELIAGFITEIEHVRFVKMLGMESFDLAAERSQNQLLIDGRFFKISLLFA
jgi:hypothetical protein